MSTAAVTATWMDATFRVFRRIDVLLPQWAHVVLLRLRASHALRGGPEPTLPLVYQRMLRMLLCDETNLRVVNGTVYFMHNDVASMQLRQFSDGDADFLLARWGLIFGKRVAVGAGFDFAECLHPGVVDAHLPRFEMAARFMCTQLRADVRPAEDGSETSVDCPYGFDVYYAFVNAVSQLLLDEHTRERAGLLYEILTDRHARIFTGWDDARELYPGHAGDKAVLAAMGKKPRNISK